jgi:hypothetical protein
MEAITDREKLTKLVEESFADQYDRRRMIVVPDTVNHLLTNGVVVREKGEPVRHYSGVYGYEGKVGEYPNGWECPFCGCDEIKKFCPNCGADMREVKINE